jgi:hypothetical protein
MTETWILALTGEHDLFYGKIHLQLFVYCFPVLFEDIPGSMRPMNHFSVLYNVLIGYGYRKLFRHNHFRFS